MSDPKPRQPRELTPGAAIQKLQALGSCAAFTERRIDEAVTKAQDEAVNDWDKEVAKILAKVHPSVRDAVKAAGVVVDEEETTAAPDLPPGAQPLPPERLAVAERGRR